MDEGQGGLAISAEVSREAPGSSGPAGGAAGPARRVPRWVWPVLLIGPGIFWLFVFIILPLVIIVVFSFGSRPSLGGIDLGFSLDNYSRIFKPIFLDILVRSLVMATATTVGCLVLAYPLAYLIARRGGRWKVLLMGLVIVPFWTPLLIRTFAWIVILGADGLANQIWGRVGGGDLNLLYTPYSLGTGLVYGYLPFMILPIFVALERIPDHVLEASRDAGAGTLATLRHVTVPLSAPGIIAGSLFVFVPVFGEFVIPDLLGGARNLMVGNLIQQQFLSIRDWAFGSALAVVLMATMLLAILIYLKKVGRELLV